MARVPVPVQRVLTALVAAPLFLAAVFWLPASWFLLFVVLLLEGAVVELARMARAWVPEAPVLWLLALVPLAAGAMVHAVVRGPAIAGPPGLHLLLAATVVSVGLGGLVLFSRTPVSQALPAAGIFAFGTAYFTVPAVSLWWLRVWDPWLVVLLLVVVWANDTFAYYVGSRFGRHRLAPVVSPKKSWEGAIAGFAAGVGITAAWAAWRLGSVPVGLLAVGAATTVAAQIGDLVESMVKRGAGVKDSGHLFPGHGGFLDRADALLFAAPVLLIGLWLLGMVPLEP